MGQPPFTVHIRYEMRRDRNPATEPPHIRKTRWRPRQGTAVVARICGGGLSGVARLAVKTALRRSALAFSKVLSLALLPVPRHACEGRGAGGFSLVQCTNAEAGYYYTHFLCISDGKIKSLYTALQPDCTSGGFLVARLDPLIFG